MKLSAHFTTQEMEHTAHRDLGNLAPPDALLNLRDLCVDHLEAIRARWGPLYVSSGYRSKAVNRAVGGSPSSAHLDGRAADLIPLAPGVLVSDIVRWLRDESTLMFDQAIDEKASGAGWLHYGIARKGRLPRRQCLVMRNGLFTPFPEG